MADWYDDRYRSRYGRSRDYDRNRSGYRNRLRDEDPYGSNHGRGFDDEGDYGYGRPDYDEDRDFYARNDYGRGANPGYGYDYESDEDFYYRNRGITRGNRRQSGEYGPMHYNSRYEGYAGPGRGYGSDRYYGSGSSPSGYGYGRRGISGRGNYGRGYDYDHGRYGSGYGAAPYYDEDDYLDTGFDADFYDTNYEPGYWSYTEYWLIPGPYSGMGPQGYERSDDRIEEDVCERLTRHGQLDASNIRVQVQDGIVTLTGTVENRNAKRLAEDTVEIVSGVKDVNNELKVRKASEQQGQQQLSMTQQDQKTPTVTRMAGRSGGGEQTER